MGFVDAQVEVDSILGLYAVGALEGRGRAVGKKIYACILCSRAGIRDGKYRKGSRQ